MKKHNQISNITFRIGKHTHYATFAGKTNTHVTYEHLIVMSRLQFMKSKIKLNIEK